MMLYCISFSTKLSVGSLEVDWIRTMYYKVISGKFITWDETQGTHEDHSQESEGGDPGEHLLPPVSGHHVLYRGEQKIDV